MRCNSLQSCYDTFSFTQLCFGPNKFTLERQPCYESVYLEASNNVTSYVTTILQQRYNIFFSSDNYISAQIDLPSSKQPGYNHVTVYFFFSVL